MNFWSWLFSAAPGTEDDWKSSELLRKEKAELQKEIDILHKEVCHWKSIALNFKRFHQ